VLYAAYRRGQALMSDTLAAMQSGSAYAQSLLVARRRHAPCARVVLAIYRPAEERYVPALLHAALHTGAHAAFHTVCLPISPCFVTVVTPVWR